MKNVITYCPNITELIPEIQERFPDRLTGDGKFAVDKTPTVSNGVKTMSLISCQTQKDYDDLSSMTKLEILGEPQEVGTEEEPQTLDAFDVIQADPDKLAIYDSVYDRSPVEISDNGPGAMWTPPFRFGSFL